MARRLALRSATSNLSATPSIYTQFPLGLTYAQSFSMSRASSTNDWKWQRASSLQSSKDVQWINQLLYFDLELCGYVVRNLRTARISMREICGWISVICLQRVVQFAARAGLGSRGAWLPGTSPRAQGALHIHVSACVLTRR